MSRYTLEYTDGQVVKIVADNDTEAETAALARFGDAAVAAEQWDAGGTSDDGEPIERLLIWETEEDSIDDPGAKAVAQLTAVRH